MTFHLVFNWKTWDPVPKARPHSALRPQGKENPKENKAQKSNRQGRTAGEWSEQVIIQEEPGLGYRDNSLQIISTDTVLVTDTRISVSYNQEHWTSKLSMLDFTSLNYTADRIYFWSTYVNLSVFWNAVYVSGATKLLQDSRRAGSLIWLHLSSTPRCQAHWIQLIL